MIGGRSLAGTSTSRHAIGRRRRSVARPSVARAASAEKGHAATMPPEVEYTLRCRCWCDLPRSSAVVFPSRLDEAMCLKRVAHDPRHCSPALTSRSHPARTARATRELLPETRHLLFPALPLAARHEAAATGADPGSEPSKLAASTRSRAVPSAPAASCGPIPSSSPHPLDRPPCSTYRALR